MKKIFNKTLLKYVLTFIITLASCFLFYLLCNLIPYKAIKDNVVDSINYQALEIVKGKFRPYEHFDVGDQIILKVNYVVDNKHPLKAVIENNYFDQGAFNPDKREEVSTQEYSRYWYGVCGYVRILLLLTDLKGIRIINGIILAFLTLILSIMLFKESKEVMLAFILGAITLSFFFIPMSILYFPAVAIALLGSIIAIKMYNKKSKNFGLLLFVLGILAGFFDEMTIVTITVSLPLFIYTFLNIRDNKKYGLIDVIKYFVIWLLGLLLTMGAKFLITIIYYGFDYLKELSYRASLRTTIKGRDNFSNIFTLLKGMFLLFYPFVNFKYGYVVSLLILIFFVINFIIYVDKKRYASLIFVSLIPIIEYLLLFPHSEQLYRYTFRALLPLVMFILYITIKQLKNVIEVCLHK